VLILAEDVADVGHVLLAAAHQRVCFLLGWRIDASTIELIFSGAFFISGSVISASNEPMRPVWFSRTTNFIWYLPGGRLKLVVYWMFFCRACSSDRDSASPSRRARGRWAA
jgi:hypothetical protein